MSEQNHQVEYDATADVLTFDGFKFSGELMRQFTATPCGIMFRIVERKDGVISVSQERDPLAAVAPELLAVVVSASVVLDVAAGYVPDTAGLKTAVKQVASDARAAIDKATGAAP